MTRVTFRPVEEQVALLARGAVDLVEHGQLVDKLTRARDTGEPLTVKVGFDPSAPDLHLGHCVLLEKMRQFQELGHRVVFVIGDFTGMIGDPTGKKATRPQLSREEVLENSETYQRQVYKVLDREKTVIEYNSSWLDPLGSSGLVKLAGKYTLARMMERDDFRTRYEAHQTITLHELLYPLVQAYDSISLEADVELGGHDQIFNLLVGRTLMKEHELDPQIVPTAPPLVGIDGSDKMSKSLGNAIGVDDPPREIYGRTMSIPDEIMWDWMLLLTGISEDELAAKRAAVEDGELHPKKVKQELARTLTERFHDADAANDAEREFEHVFTARGVPDDIPEISVSSELPLFKMLVAAELANSNGEARRLVGQGAVSIDGDKLVDPFAHLAPGAHLVKVGKRRFARLAVS